MRDYDRSHDLALSVLGAGLTKGTLDPGGHGRCPPCHQSQTFAAPSGDRPVFLPSCFNRTTCAVAARPHEIFALLRVLSSGRTLGSCVAETGHDRGKAVLGLRGSALPRTLVAHVSELNMRNEVCAHAAKLWSILRL
jgi:hypothetical protein